MCDSPHPRHLHSFPTRRSSDLYVAAGFRVISLGAFAGEGVKLVQKLVTVGILWLGALQVIDGDRKSTRLNSSLLGISYAVFCLKKKITACIMYYLMTQRRMSAL